ncbi:MAG: TrmH family RNA methyltransferase [Anaerolineae bacterium]
MITSAQNPKIKLVRALAARPRQRREAGAFLVEGIRLVEEAGRSPWPIRFVLHDEALSQRGSELIAQFRARQIDCETVSPTLLKSLSETKTPQGILAVVEWHPLPLPASPTFVLIPDQIRDPGNLGTLLRSAAAAGVEAVLLPPETTDAFAPKVLRAGMGAHFRLPIQPLPWDEIAEQTRGLRIYLAEMDGLPCWQANLRAPLALIVGGEAEGASRAARQLATQKISIPMRAQIESLNAGVAGSVLMFEVMRQRFTA